MISAAIFPTVGGVAIGLWLENVSAGVVGYYALLALAVASPEGAALRAGFARRLKGAPPQPLADDAASPSVL